MLKVGIHDNVVVHKVTKNDKGQLVVGFKKAEEVDMMAALSGSGSTSFEQQEQDIIPFDLKVTDFNGKERTGKEVLTIIADYKDPLDHIARTYLTSDKIKWNPFVGTDVKNDNYNETLTVQTTLSKIQQNINEQFISMMQGVTGPNSKKVRVLFIRSSQAKHYAKLRSKFLDSNPFIEPMDVPVSRLKFTDYEKKMGLDKGDAVSSATPPVAADAKSAADLFTVPK